MGFSRDDKLAAIHSYTCNLAKLASQESSIPEEHLIKVTIEAEGELSDDIMGSLEDPDTAEEIINAIVSSADKLKDKEKVIKVEEDDESTDTVNKLGGLTMSNKRIAPDYCDLVNDKCAKLAYAHDDPTVEIQTKLAYIKEDPYGMIAAIMDKLSNYNALLNSHVKLAESYEAMREDVAELTGKDYPKADLLVQDEHVKYEETDTDEYMNEEGEDKGTSVMKGDLTGKKSHPLNKAKKADPSVGVTPNKKTQVGDVIAGSQKTGAKLASVLRDLQKNRKK